MRSVSHVSVPPCLNVSGAVRPPESGFGSPTLLRSWSAVYVAKLTSDERQADLRPPVLRAGNRFSLATLPLPAASTS